MIKIISYLIYNYLQCFEIRDIYEQSIFELPWLKKLKREIEISDNSEKETMLLTVNELIKSARALDIEIKIFDESQILKNYNNVIVTPDFKNIIINFKINDTEINLSYPTQLELDLIRLNSKDIIHNINAIFSQKLYDFDFNLKYKNKVVLETNDINAHKKSLKELNYILNLENFFIEDYKYIKNFENSIAYKKYSKEREIIPEIISRNQKETLINNPGQESINSLKQIITEKKIGINNIGLYKTKLFRK